MVSKKVLHLSSNTSVALFVSDKNENRVDIYHTVNALLGM